MRQSQWLLQIVTADVDIMVAGASASGGVLPEQTIDR
jgi:hypothetical protein